MAAYDKADLERIRIAAAMQMKLSSDDLSGFGQEQGGEGVRKLRKLLSAIKIREGSHGNRPSARRRIAWRASLLPLGRKLVTGPASGENNARVLRVRFDLATQPSDQIVDTPIKALGVSAADRVQQPVA